MSSTLSSSSAALGDPQTQADVVLLQEIAHGNREALGKLYDRYARPLFGTAVRILRDAAEAEDIVHDVFIALWIKARDFNPERGSPLAWAITLTRNRAIDRIRMRKRHTEILEQSAATEFIPAPSAGPGNSGEQLWIKEKAAAVRTAVDELAPEQRRALELAFFSGLTQQEIALQLQEPLGTVKARIRRGLLKLRERLAHRL